MPSGCPAKSGEAEPINACLAIIVRNVSIGCSQTIQVRGKQVQQLQVAASASELVRSALGQPELEFQCSSTRQRYAPGLNTRPPGQLPTLNPASRIHHGFCHGGSLRYRKPYYPPTVAAGVHTHACQPGADYVSSCHAPIPRSVDLTVCALALYCLGDRGGVSMDKPISAWRTCHA